MQNRDFQSFGEILGGHQEGAWQEERGLGGGCENSKQRERQLPTSCGTGSTAGPCGQRLGTGQGPQACRLGQARDARLLTGEQREPGKGD